MGNLYLRMLTLVIVFAGGYFLLCFISYLIKSANYKGSAYQQNTGFPFFKVLFDKGAYGEYLISRYLRKISPPGQFLFNVYLPKEKGETTEIDALLIHPSGIYVFESKNYSGWIFGTESQRNWTQTFPGGGRKNHFFNPILQNELHLKWLKTALADYPALPFYSYILFSNRCTLKSITLTSDRARVMNRFRVYSSVAAQSAQAGVLLDENTMKEVYGLLYPYSQATEALKKKHIEAIQTLYPPSQKAAPSSGELGAPQSRLLQEAAVNPKATPLSQDAAPPPEKPGTPNNELLREAGKYPKAIVSPASQGRACPKCGKPLVRRTAQKGANAGQQFWGCSGFPRCRYIEQAQEEQALAE